MANTEPPVSTAADVGALREQARSEASVPVGFLATVTRGMRGEELTEMAELREAGAIGFTDDGLPIASARMMRRALQYQRLCGGTIALHEEDPELSGGGVMHEGPVSAALGLAGVPSVSESTMIARDAALASYEEGRIHVQHLSAAESVEAVRAAKAAGVRISAEATPHHLCLTDEAVRSLDARRFKMNPPLRAEADRQALIEGLRDGTIECIATDHAPHATRGKGGSLRAGGDGGDRPGDRLRGDPHRPRPARGARPRAARRADGGRRRALRPGAADAGARQRGQRRPLRPRRRVDGRGGRLREPLLQLLVRRAHADRTGADDRRRRPGGLSPAQLLPGSRSMERSASPTSCSRTAPASTATLCGHPAAVTGEVVFNTAMTGYQESVTDPSYAGQIIVFTYPLIGNYGVSAEAMESDRIHARGAIMRDAKNREDVASAEGGWLDWLGDCGVPGISGVDTRALVRHIRDRGAMRGGIFPGEVPEAEAREAIAAEPSMDGADLARTVTPPEPVRFEGDGPHVVGIDTGVKMSIVRQLRERGCRVTLLPCTTPAAEVLAEDPDLVFLANGPGDPAALGYVVDTVRELVGAAPGLRHLPRPPAALPRGRAGDLQAALRPPRRQPPGQGPRDRADRHHLPEPRLRGAGPGGEPRIDGDDPVRWETDFGAAELSHLNLYDRTVEGLVLKDVAGATVQYHPEAGPGPHDARHLFDGFLELAACLGATTSRRSSWSAPGRS